MIIIGIERGNKITTMHEKSSDEAAKIIKELKNHYALIDKPGKNQWAKETFSNLSNMRRHFKHFHKEKEDS